MGYLKPLNKRVKIYPKDQPPMFGWVHELMGYSNVLPHYFAILDDGSERDLRGDRYHLVDEELS